MARGVITAAVAVIAVFQLTVVILGYAALGTYVPLADYRIVVVRKRTIVGFALAKIK